MYKAMLIKHADSSVSVENFGKSRICNIAHQVSHGGYRSSVNICVLMY